LGDERAKDVIAGDVECFDGDELDETPLPAPTGEHSNDVDGLGDERARHGDDSFLDELLQAP
jgi:hypothetical protein